MDFPNGAKEHDALFSAVRGHRCLMIGEMLAIADHVR
jgi:hypothetical protein